MLLPVVTPTPNIIWYTWLQRFAACSTSCCRLRHVRREERGLSKIGGSQRRPAEPRTPGRHPLQRRFTRAGSRGRWAVLSPPSLRTWEHHVLVCFTSGVHNEVQAQRRFQSSNWANDSISSLLRLLRCVVEGPNASFQGGGHVSRRQFPIRRQATGVGSADISRTIAVISTDPSANFKNIVKRRRDPCSAGTQCCLNQSLRSCSHLPGPTKVCIHSHT